MLPCPQGMKGSMRNLETRACNPLSRLAEALGNTSESRALIGCFSSANYYTQLLTIFGISYNKHNLI
jgi:hypothetical protein